MAPGPRARHRHRLGPALLACLAAGLWTTALAGDETSSGDKLRILYSNRFSFTDSGLPLMTVEVMSGQRSVELVGEHGLLVLPDGGGGPEIRSGNRFQVTVEDARPGVVVEWTVVERADPDSGDKIDEALARWKRRGHRARVFEIGTIFAVKGDVMDSREALIAIDPVRAHQGSAQARKISERYHIDTEVYTELVSRPEGTIVARSGAAEIRNPSVLWFAPVSNDATVTVLDVVTGTGGSQLKTGREDRKYFGSIYVTVGIDGKLTVANAVASDDLLAGLVPSEIYSSAPMEALKAQAVAARTELLQKIGTRHHADPFLVCSNQHCQVYSGAGKEHPRTTRAVRETRGLVLKRADGRLVDARYSAACGGHGEHNENIWGGAPDSTLRGRFDGDDQRFAEGIGDDSLEQFLRLSGNEAHCGGTRYSKGRYRWRTRISATELSKRIARSFPEVGDVRALEPLSRGVSGRIRILRIHGNTGSADVNGDLQIRRLLGGLRSSLFTPRVIGDRGKPEAFEFVGAGFGHGVGLCQLGAIGMAEKRNGFRIILQHYYPTSSIRAAY